MNIYINQLYENWLSRMNTYSNVLIRSTTHALAEDINLRQLNKCKRLNTFNIIDVDQQSKQAETSPPHQLKINIIPLIYIVLIATCLVNPQLFD